MVRHSSSSSHWPLLQSGFAHIIIGFHMDAVPLRLVYHQLFLYCVSLLLDIGFFAKWCWTSDVFHMMVIFFPTAKVLASPVQKGEILYMSLIEIPVPWSKLSSVSAEKRSYAIILIAVLKAMELSNTLMQDNTHIGWKRAGRTRAITCRECHSPKKMPSIVVLSHLCKLFFFTEQTHCN